MVFTTSAASVALAANGLAFQTVIDSATVTPSVQIGGGTLALTLAVGLFADWVGADKVIVSIHHDDMESVSVAHVTHCLGSVNDLAVLVFQLSWF